MQRSAIVIAIVLGLLSAIGPLAIDFYLPALPSLAADLNAPVATTQLTLMAFFLSFGLFQLVYGPAADMFGRKTPLYFGLGLFGLSSLACVFAPNIESLIALRFVQGIGAASVMVVPRAIVRDLYRGVAATRLMTTIMLVISISPMLAPLGGSLLTEPFGWRAVFWAIAAAAALSLVLTRFALKETLAQPERVPFRARAMLEAFATLLRDPRFMGLSLIGGFGAASFFSFLAAGSFLYASHWHLSPTQFSLAFAFNAVGFFAATQFAAPLMARFGAMPLIRASVAAYAFAAMALLVAMAARFDAFPVWVALLLAVNATLGLVIPTSMVLSLEDHGPIAGTASALGGTLQMVVGAAAIAVTSAVFDGTPFSLAAVIAVAGLGALVLSVSTLRTTAPARI